jgi:prepilin-type N-terminal cleavage/methylation domain-containing protein
VFFLWVDYVSQLFFYHRIERFAMRKNFTLIELMIVVAIIAIIAAIAIPGLLRARISSNETSAVGSLRSTSTAQNQFQNATVKDFDLDGVGEYGYFVELSGQANVPRGTSAAPARPTFLTSVFGATSSSSVPAGLANKSGYNFFMYLPSDDGAAAPIQETGLDIPPAAAALTVVEVERTNNQETRWCCFGWPTSAGNSGNKAFFVNQSGEVIATNNQAVGLTVFFYSGNTPAGTMPDDIFEIPGSNLDSPILTGTPTAGDSIVWNPTN